MALEHGHHYYTNVRAITGAGSVLDSVSSGFTIDVTEPKVTFTTHNSSQEGVIYQKDTYSLVSSWDITDNESDVQHVAISAGTASG